MNIQEKMKVSITEAVDRAYWAAVEAADLPSAEGAFNVKEMVRLEVPKDKQHGDFACNVAMVLANRCGWRRGKLQKRLPNIWTAVRILKRLRWPVPDSLTFTSVPTGCMRP